MSMQASRFIHTLPEDWTPQQALAVYEVLTALSETVWNRYEMALIELLASELDQHNASPPDLFDFDDPLPF